MLRRAFGPISAALGPATCFPEGGGPCGADDADDAFTTFGVFADTFAAVLSNVGYADAAAASDFAGDGAFVGFGDGAFVGFSDGVLGVCFTFDASRRFAASICISLGGGASSLGGGAGLLASLSCRVLLDLAFDFGAGSDDGLVVPLGVFPVIRLIAASLVSAGKGSYGGGFVGIGGFDTSISCGGGDAAFTDAAFTDVLL